MNQVAAQRWTQSLADETLTWMDFQEVEHKLTKIALQLATNTQRDGYVELIGVSPVAGSDEIAAKLSFGCCECTVIISKEEWMAAHRVVVNS
jgi:hypothetical protein